MEVWQHEKRKFEYTSIYVLDERAWHHELTGLDTPAYVCLVVPDATPGDGPFTPAPSQATLVFNDGEIPWPIWLRFIAEIEETGDTLDRPGPSR